MDSEGYWLVVSRLEAGAIVVADSQDEAVERFRKHKRRYLRRAKLVDVEIVHVVPAPPSVWKRA